MVFINLSRALHPRMIAIVVPCTTPCPHQATHGLQASVYYEYDPTYLVIGIEAIPSMLCPHYVLY